MTSLAPYYKKYDIPAPRYTSYPTVPYWQKEAPSETIWLSSLRTAMRENGEISLYIHLPFCEKLCTYCACNKRITRQHKVEEPYIEHLLKEWDYYMAKLPAQPVLRELHLGGGTPTFFSPENLKYFLSRIIGPARIASPHDFSFEAHPNNTTYEHLKVLKDLGFNRLSIGVQDFSPDIMAAINRQQMPVDVERVFEQARCLGYESINIDLIYGLPFQTLSHIEFNIKEVERLRPDRIAYYSYAHVPWKTANQRGFSVEDLASGEDKQALYERGKMAFEAMGYMPIGMDHFALPTDALSIAKEEGSLHRNFMGYTPFHTAILLGLGASAISDSGRVIVQNKPKVEDYQQTIEEDELAIYRGHSLNEEDFILRRHILNLLCHYQTSWKKATQRPTTLKASIQRLKEFEKDGLIQLKKDGVEVTDAGKAFVRNIALCFDAHYWRRQPKAKIFSQSI